MSVGLGVTFTLLAVSVGGDINCSNSTVKAEAGSNIVISYKVDPPVDLSAETLDFKRNDGSKAVVHSYRHYKDDHDPQAPQYRNRTALKHADLRKGIMSLNISSVNQSDEGPYKISVPDLKAFCVFHLDIVERNQQNKMIRKDFNTTEPTEKTATKSDYHDAAKTKFGIAFAFFIAVVLVIIRNNWIVMLIKKLKRIKGGRKEDDLMTQKEGIKADADLKESVV